jgi:DNA-binding MarR family transcriptional regulator
MMVKRLTNPLRERPVPLGSLLNAAGQRLSAELDAALREAGFDDLRAAHAPLFTAIDADGTRVTELAQRAAMSKQAVGELVRHLETRGYVSVGVDPHDRRAKRVGLTERGWRVVDLGTAVIDEYDRWLAEAVGAEHVESLRGALDRIIAAPSRWPRR